VGYHHNHEVRVSIGPRYDSTGVVMHEVLHALGFWHEQSRADRDNFVTVYFDNIIPCTSILIMLFVNYMYYGS